MPVDFAGISNCNEFYADFYLEQLFDDDLKLYAKKGGESNASDKTPTQRLTALRREFFAVRSELENRTSRSRRWEATADFVGELLVALGYAVDRSDAPIRETNGGKTLPLRAEVRRPDGSPWLWALEVVDEADGEGDPLRQKPFVEQYPATVDPKKRLDEVEFETIVTREIFGLGEEAPRWVLLVRYDRIVLIDRTKWIDKRSLQFDLLEIFDRREPTTLAATAALLSRESLCPNSGAPILDEWEEKSRQHAVSVSNDLKYAAREAVELLGNEAARWMRENGRGVYNRNLADKLTQECLIYLYRLLFAFYVESRSEKLGYVPMKADAYRFGYSLEALRDFENAALTTPREQDGYYLDESIKLLFGLFAEGAQGPTNGDLFDDANDGASVENAEKTQIPISYGFRFDRVDGWLFAADETPTLDVALARVFGDETESDEAKADKKGERKPKTSTPLLDAARIRNVVWRRIIELLSLTDPSGGKGESGKRGGKKTKRGRVSYARLGVAQLGAVYEGLLAYDGFFAEEELYEIKKAGEEYDPLQQAFFVNKDALDDYGEDERVYEYVEDAEGVRVKRLKKYERGAFVYRLAGRDREKSASYYTPASLTQCLVKYALKELIGDKPGDPNYKTADEILELTVCEPAMGSAAFLNEAVNQLADAYLARKQRELGEWIESDKLERETQKARAFIADRNVFGVDLNPTAVKLGDVSLWLNSIFAGRFVPWFGGQLVCGNSLVGARRDVYDSKLVTQRRKGAATWLDSAPTRVEPGSKRDPETIYSFLLPDLGMASYDDKVVKKRRPEALKKIAEWKKEFCAPFTDDERKLLERFSRRVDELWDEHVAALRKFREETTDPLPIFGRPDDPLTRTTLAEKNLRLRRLEDDALNESSTPYKRLKAAMDLWCALWFWPIDKADMLPTRWVYFATLEYIFQDELTSEFTKKLDAEGRPTLFPVDGRDEALTMGETLGRVRIDDLRREIPIFDVACEVAEERRFLHWELTFADIFEDRGGFDLILGNPPWVKVEWNETGILSDFEPSFAIHKLSASRVAELRDETFEANRSADPEKDLETAYLSEYVEMTGRKNFQGSATNYPALKGVQTNDFKNFICQGLRVANKGGVVGYVHPEGVYDDPNGGKLRREIYSRLRYHLQFVNELSLFEDIHHNTLFSLNILGAKKERPQFKHIANLFADFTVDESFEKISSEKVGGIKTDANKWNVNGHQDRVISVGDKELALFAKLYDAPGTPPDEARLPSLHTIQLLDVLEKFAAYPRRLGDLQDEYRSTVMWDETGAQKDGTIRRDTRFPETPRELILSGPHFYVGAPLYKSPREICRLNSDYDVIDLTVCQDSYLPRANYVPDCSLVEYERRTPTVPWDASKKVTDYYRVVFRKMLSQAGERTLIAAICPEMVGHILLCFSVCFQDLKNTLKFTTACMSLPFDYFIKASAKASFLNDLCAQLPFIEENYRQLAVRGLALNCLTTHYAELWRECWDDAFTSDAWTLDDERLAPDAFSRLTSTWRRDYPLRSDFARRQALIEIDVLVARALGLTLDELCAIYRIQFPVLRQNEADTWYDRDGRIVFTCSKGLTGVGFSRPEWNEIKDAQDGVFRREVVDGWLPNAPTRTIEYRAPFDRRDREEDYRVAWEAFDRRADVEK